MEDSRAGSPLGSEINVNNARSKSIVGSSPMKSPKMTQKRKLNDEQAATAVDPPKKKKRKVKKGSGRPRDPSLLQKSVQITEGEHGSRAKESTNVEQAASLPNMEGTVTEQPAGSPAAENAPIPVEAILAPADAPVAEVERKATTKKAKKQQKRKKADDTATQPAHLDGRRISPVGRPGPRKSKKKISKDPLLGSGHRTVNAHAESAQAELGDRPPAAERPTGSTQENNSNEDFATSDEVLAELNVLLEKIPHLTRKNIPRKTVRLSLMRRSLACIGDYLHTWLPEGDGMVDQIWDQIAETAWPPHTRPKTTGASLLSVYRKQAEEDERLPIQRISKGEGDRVANSIREELQTSTQPNGSPDTPADAVAILAAQEPASTSHVAERPPALTPPESTHHDKTPREPSASFNEGVRGVAGWVEAHDERAADPNVASPRRERAQRTLQPEPKPPVIDLNIGRALAVALPDPLENGPSSGLFTAAEKAAADDVFDYVCQRNDFDIFEFRASTIDWRNTAPQLKEELAAVFPNRNMRAIRKFAMRRYRPKKDGAFEKEEDERLINAVAEYGEHWQDVADVVGDRTSEQCRDRYRLILKYGDNRAVGPWSQEEEASLIKAVHEVMEQIKQANIDKGDLVNDDGEVQRMIRWETVASTMNGGRSGKRCGEKWNLLMARNHGQIPEVRAAAVTVQAPIAPYDGNSKKQRAVNRKYDIFAIGDVYDVLDEIRTSMDDHSKVYSHESTVWAIITSKNPESRFTGPLRRKAYHEALGTYGQKGTVAKQATIAGKAAAMVAWLDGYAKRKKIEKFERRYLFEKAQKRKPKAKPVEPAASRPVSTVDSRAAEPAQPKTRPAPSNVAPRSGRPSKFLSAEKVVDSDAEDEDMIDAKPALLDDPDGDYEEDHPANDVDDNMDDVNDDDEGQEFPGSDPPAYEDVKMPVIPEAQQDQTMAGAQAATRALGDAMTVSSLNSRWNRGVARRSLGADEFMARCRRVGRRQHDDYMAT